MRSYTVDEIDRMREAVRAETFGGESIESCELILRTHMLNGSDPDEVVAFYARRREELTTP